eukprot:tig00000828_g4603.t1
MSAATGAGPLSPEEKTRGRRQMRAETCCDTAAPAPSSSTSLAPTCFSSILRPPSLACMLGCIPLFAARAEDEPAHTRNRPSSSRAPQEGEDLPDPDSAADTPIDTPREGEIEEIFGSNSGKYERILARIKQHQAAMALAASGDLPTVVVGRAADPESARQLPAWNAQPGSPVSDPGEGVAEPSHLPPPLAGTMGVAAPAAEADELETEAKDLHQYLKAMQNTLRSSAGKSAPGTPGTPGAGRTPAKGTGTPQHGHGAPPSPANSTRSVEDSPSAWDAESNFRRLRGTRFRANEPVSSKRNILSYR